tara:strand:- start:496 stop:768 length:273 start_codon:yes stop_codon:yes gene_type:complete
MRKVNDNHGREHTIHAWYILVNGWEYYQTEPTDEENIAYGFVHGFEDEWGSFSTDEMGEYIMAHAKGDELNEIRPPIGWSWKEEVCTSSA